ncbi:MAG TPA: hypothetical protein VNP73_00990 [Actinomycetota bacterium]|nr:hypothetical protein [Actinomycetota bacterium]
MPSGVRSYVRQHHVGLLALFVALGGTTAWAVDGPNPGQNTIGSEDIIGNEVKSDDIGNGRIFNVDIADEIITGQKLLNGTVTGADVDENTIDNTHAAVEPVTTTCDVEAETICATEESFNTDEGDDVLVTASATFYGTGMGPDAGRCRILADDVGIGHVVFFGQADDAHDSALIADGVHFQALKSNLASGNHAFSLTCFEDDGDVRLGHVELIVLQYGT